MGWVILVFLLLSGGRRGNVAQPGAGAGRPTGLLMEHGRVGGWPYQIEPVAGGGYRAEVVVSTDGATSVSHRESLAGARSWIEQVGHTLPTPDGSVPWPASWWPEGEPFE